MKLEKVWRWSNGLTWDERQSENRACQHTNKTWGKLQLGQVVKFLLFTEPDDEEKASDTAWVYYKRVE